MNQRQGAFLALLVAINAANPASTLADDLASRSSWSANAQSTDSSLPAASQDYLQHNNGDYFSNFQSGPSSGSWSSNGDFSVDATSQDTTLPISRVVAGLSPVAPQFRVRYRITGGFVPEPPNQQNPQDTALADFLKALPSKGGFQLQPSAEIKFVPLPANPYAQLCQTRDPNGGFSTLPPGVPGFSGNGPAQGFTSYHFDDYEVPAFIPYKEYNFGPNYGNRTVPFPYLYDRDNRLVPTFFVTDDTKGNYAIKTTVFDPASVKDPVIQAILKEILRHEFMHALITVAGAKELAYDIAAVSNVPGGTEIGGWQTFDNQLQMIFSAEDALEIRIKATQQRIANTHALFDFADLLVNLQMDPEGKFLNDPRNLHKGTADPVFYFPDSDPPELYRCYINPSRDWNYLQRVQSVMEQWETQHFVIADGHEIPAPFLGETLPGLDALYLMDLSDQAMANFYHFVWK